MQVRVDEGVHGGHNALLVLACSWRHLGEKVRFQGVLFVVLESIGN
jgi:hypothetical protein